MSQGDISFELQPLELKETESITIDEPKEAIASQQGSAPSQDLKKAQLEPTRQSILGMIRHLLPEALLNKSSVCQHQNGCFENTIRKCSKNFLIGFGIQLLFKNLLLIVKPAKLLRNL